MKRFPDLWLVFGLAFSSPARPSLSECALDSNLSVCDIVGLSLPGPRKIVLRKQVSMNEKIKELVQKKDICVLATVKNNEPHCSLMAYAVDKNAGEFYFTTARSTKKFSNILNNPAVSLLIDSREKRPRTQAQALTVTGVCSPVAEKEDKRRIKNILLNKHPHLKEILDKPDSEILRVSVNSLLLLDGLTDAYYEKIV